MKHILTCLLILTFVFNVKAQDTIYLKNSTTIACNVSEIGNTDIFYSPWKQDEPRFEIAKNLVDSISYNNGSRFNFTSSNTNSDPELSLDSTATSPIAKNDNTKLSDNYLEAIGIQDAYNVKLNNLGTASFCGAIGCGVIGIVIPALEIDGAFKRTEIKGNALNKSKVYTLAYTKELNKRSVKRIINSYLGGIGVQIAVLVALLYTTI